MSMENSCRFTGYVKRVYVNDAGTMASITLSVRKSFVREGEYKSEFIEVKFLGAKDVETIMKFHRPDENPPMPLDGSYLVVEAEYRIEEYNGEKRPALIGSTRNVVFGPRGDSKPNTSNGGQANASRGHANIQPPSDEEGQAPLTDDDDVPF